MGVVLCSFARRLWCLFDMKVWYLTDVISSLHLHILQPPQPSVRCGLSDVMWHLVFQKNARLGEYMANWFYRQGIYCVKYRSVEPLSSGVSYLQAYTLRIADVGHEWVVFYRSIPHALHFLKRTYCAKRGPITTKCRRAIASSGLYLTHEMCCL